MAVPETPHGRQACLTCVPIFSDSRSRLSASSCSSSRSRSSSDSKRPPIDPARARRSACQSGRSKNAGPPLLFHVIGQRAAGGRVRQEPAAIGHPRSSREERIPQRAGREILRFLYGPEPRPMKQRLAFIRRLDEVDRSIAGEDHRMRVSVRLHLHDAGLRQRPEFWPCGEAILASVHRRHVAHAVVDGRSDDQGTARAPRNGVCDGLQAMLPQQRSPPPSTGSRARRRTPASRFAVPDAGHA